MKVINLRMHQIRSLKELKIERGVLNTEGMILILKKRYAKTKDNKPMVFKYLDAQEDMKVMARKMYTINMLNGSEAYSSIDELVIPDTAVSVDGNIAGFAMPLVENHRNLGAILNDDDVSLSEKLPYLIQLGQIVDKIERIDGESFRFQFGDLNEFNFVIDVEDKVHAVDLDSAYLGQDEPSNMAYYLLKNKYLADFKDKYKTTNSGIIIPSDNTDLYCLNMIILNTLAKRDIFKEDIDVYNMYISYLSELGLPRELIGAFTSIYLPIDNINTSYALKKVDPSIEKDTDFKVFKKEYNIK